jgi:hypothetical protein
METPQLTTKPAFAFKKPGTTGGCAVQYFPERHVKSPEEEAGSGMPVLSAAESEWSPSRGPTVWSQLIARFRRTNLKESSRTSTATT